MTVNKFLKNRKIFRRAIFARWLFFSHFFQSFWEGGRGHRGGRKHFFSKKVSALPYIN